MIRVKLGSPKASNAPWPGVIIAECDESVRWTVTRPKLSRLGRILVEGFLNAEYGPGRRPSDDWRYLRYPSFGPTRAAIEDFDGKLLFEDPQLYALPEGTIP